MADELTFAVSLFKRIFQTEPERHAWSLEQLVQALQTFEVKRDTWKEITRELEKIDNAWSAWREGRDYAGFHYSNLLRAHKTADKAGEDADEAVRAKVEEMRKAAHKRAKKGQRGWSPVLYPPEVKRGSEQVIHISCLVLDHDDGTPIAEATAPWEEFFHIVHTTWSHTPEHPKFRCVMPLADPVFPKDWPAVWQWVEARVGQSVDPSSKSIGRIYGLPTIRSEEWPREAFVHGGELLDLVVHGVVDACAPRVSIEDAGGAAPPERPDIVAPDLPPELGGGLFDDDDDAAVSAPVRDDVWDRIHDLERRVNQLEVRLGVSGELQRLARLYEEGALTDEEFADAKRVVLQR